MGRGRSGEAHENACKKFEETPATETADAIPANTYAETVKKTKDELRKLVNKTMAMHQLLTTKQGERNWMEFIKDLEDKAHILNFDVQPYKQNEAVKDLPYSEWQTPDHQITRS